SVRRDSRRSIDRGRTARPRFGHNRPPPPVGRRVTRLLVVRHGETTWNHEWRLQGQTDVELSDFGRAQARRLADRLKHEPIVVAYSSDLKRCWETATIALSGRDVPLHPDRRLREVHLGEWQGQTADEVRARRPEEVDWV